MATELSTGPDTERSSPMVLSWASVVFVAIIALVWGMVIPVWRAAHEAAPIVAQFEREAGGSLTDHEWYIHQEAQDTFSVPLHPTATVSASRFGHVDGDWLYEPFLALKAAVGGVLLILASVVALFLPRRRRRLAFLVVLASVVVPLVVLRGYGHTISAVSAIVE